MGIQTKILITAAVAGMIGAAGAPALARADEDSSSYKCVGGNSCKGKGACATAKNSCAGHNACAGQGYVMTKDKAECNAKKTELKKGKDEKKDDAKS